MKLSLPAVTIVALALHLLAAPLAAAAQQPAKVARIGILGETRGPQWETFRQGLRDLGYIEGQTIVLEWRWSEGRVEQFPALAADLVRLGVDIIVTEGGLASLAAKKATSAIPIVMAISADPVGIGLVPSLARPGGNITGMASLSPDLGAKQMEMLKEILPGLRRLAVLGNPAMPAHGLMLKEIEAAARTLRVDLHLVAARDATELDDAFLAMNRAHVRALIVMASPTFDAHQRRLADLTLKSRLPAAYNKTLFAEAGGLMAYGAVYLDFFRRAAAYVDKILKGAKPGDLPVEQPTKFELVINLKTAKALGLTIPQSVLIRADQVIQ